MDTGKKEEREPRFGKILDYTEHKKKEFGDYAQKLCDQLYFASTRVHVAVFGNEKIHDKVHEEELEFIDDLLLERVGRFIRMSSSDSSKDR